MNKMVVVLVGGSLVIAEVSGKLDKFNLQPSAADAPHDRVETPEGIFLIDVGSSLSPSDKPSLDEWYQPTSQPLRFVRWHPALDPAVFAPYRYEWGNDVLPAQNTSPEIQQ